MKKKLLTLSVVVCMVLGITACGKKSTGGNYEVSEEPVTLTYYYQGGNVGQYTMQVQDKLNEILKGIDGYEHITIELYPSTNNYRQLTLAQTSGKQIDLVSTYQMEFTTGVANGDYLCLDDLMEQFPDAVSEIPDWVVDYGKIDGKQYMVPTYQQASNLSYLAIPEEYFDMYLKEKNTTREAVTDLIQHGTIDDKLNFMEDLCLAVRKGTGSDTKWLFPGETWAHNLLSHVFFNIEYIQTEFDHYIFREGADAPEYWGMTSDFKKVMKRFAKWYEEGLLHPDCTTVNFYQLIGENYLNEESYVCEFVKNTATEEYQEEYMESLNGGIPMVCIRTTDHAYIPSEWAAGGHAIYVDSEHPAEAMMIIELLRTEKGKEFYNTLIWGLEGIHWEWEDKENDRIRTLEFDTVQGGATYSAYKFNNGNVMNAWKNQAVLPGFYEYVEEKVHNGDDTVFSPAMGINWDLSNVKSQMSSVSAVEGEYCNTIYIAKDWEARYDEYIEKLEAAGVNDIIDELTRQYEEFEKSK